MHLQLSSLIDPQLLAFVDESRAFYARRPSGRGPTSLNELLVVREAMPTHVECEPAPVLETVSAGGRSVSVRIHTPRNRLAPGVLLEIHTGGFYLGSAARSDVQNRRLVDTLGVAVVSVDYRLAPEHPWPAAPDDCETAARWIIEEGREELGTGPMLFCGASAGATPG